MKKITYWTLFIAWMVAASSSAAMKSTAHIRWVTYQNKRLSARMTVPAAWVAEKTTQAMVFHSPGSLKVRAGVGLMRSANRGTIENAEDAFMATEGMEGWARNYTRVAGMRALKVVGHPKGNPNMKMVRYFIATPYGPYLLQCMAPAETWHLYIDLFATIVNSIRFSPSSPV